MILTKTLFKLIRICLIVGGVQIPFVDAQSEPPSSATQEELNAWAIERMEVARKLDEMKLVAQIASENDPVYTRLFSDLGLNEDEEERFKSRMIDLHWKAIAAGNHMRVLLKARNEFYKDIHAALGDDGYQRYREYEESKPARREYDLLKEFAQENNLACDLSFSETIIQLIKDAKATTTETWHGPYDPRPHPEFYLEVEPALNKHTRKLSELKQASSSLVGALPKSGLPHECQQLIKDYYVWKVEEKQQWIEIVRRPREEERRMNERRGRPPRKDQQPPSD